MKKPLPHVIIDQIIHEEVEYVFGVTGKAISPFIDAILDYPELNFISSKHESGASLMAFGYAQGTGKVGVCCSTTAGGSTNMVTGVATAYMNSVPLLVLTGQSSTHEYGKGAFQESTGIGQSINTVDLYKPITKESFALANPHTIAETIRYALRSAMSGRKGPVHVNIPFDFFHKEIELKTFDNGINLSTKNYQCTNAGMEEVIRLMEQAAAPVLLTGWGTVLSGAEQEVVKFAEQFEIPVATTLQGKGVISYDNPLHLGVLGVAGHATAQEYIFEQSDLIIAIGTNFDEFTTFNWNPVFLKKKIIQVDVDYREIGKNYPVAAGFVGDARLILTNIRKKLEEVGVEKKALKQKISDVVNNTGKFANPKIMSDDSIPVKPQRLMKEIGENTPDNTIFLADSGAHWAWGMHYLPVREGGGFYPTIGLAAMGASICSSIGVQLSKPDNPVVCICGDGAFLMSGNEVATAEQFDIPVIWVVLNDSLYNLPATSMLKQFNRQIGVHLSKTDFSKLAEAYNVKGYRVEDPNDLSAVIKEAIAEKKPAVIDVVIDPDEFPPVGQRKLND
ncbi:MAG: thiamine pyrophosphate-binding protein [Bacteroidales bacterium]